ncbi:CBF/Mak21 family-domain-containing protein [Microdochium trichocladiopsis]|uniref:CBF/Mak21 family-domain-containing protein n=1 Tax=Microdochium trichocladiopsis TaxID=1682393 RepID=A0A9P8Y375_9PEZI|nr:CBF/Mak21 family-domain-containing protein [Microdochium trichocladiopsis]KAH7026362.1 CBF/Mak21 family-domain-containing protein [Microdochium trichocladiopsis]
MASSSFNDAALAKLTAKIDSKLSNGSAKSQQDKRQPASPSSKPVTNGARSIDKKRKQSTDHNSDRKFSSSKRSRRVSQSDQRAPIGAQNDRPGPASSRRQKHHGAPASDKPAPGDKNVLLEEIIALGGNEEDLDLVGDADSDDEGALVSVSNADKDLRAELAQFAAALGFDKIAPTNDEDEDEEFVEGGKETETTNPEQDQYSDESSNGADDVEDKSQVDSSDEDEDHVVGGAPVVTGQSTAEATRTIQPAKAPKGKTIFEQRPDWHSAPLPALPSATSSDVTAYAATIANLKTYAVSLLQQDTATYNKSQSASSNHKFMSTIMTSGTMSDKVSALTLAAQESPLHNIKTLENLLALACKRNRGQALAALAAMVDLLGPGMMLPSDRRLYAFSSQPGLLGVLHKKQLKIWSAGQPLPGNITQQHLISWAFEDWLKESYFKLIQALEVWCDDEIDYSRTKAVDMVYALLKDKPEQESNLLRLLVNKLGDRERKISSRASYLLLQLLNIHPAMKAIVIRSIEQDIIFRQGQDMRAKYTAINTLNQTILSSKEPGIADSLLKIYFGLFVSLLKTGALSQLDGEAQATPKAKSNKRRRGPPPPKRDKQVDAQTAAAQDAASKLVSAILTGVNRAVPFSEADSSTLESHLDTLFRITHSSNFNTSIQALMLVQQLSASRHLATERFYRTLYESLLDPRLISSSKQALFLNLLYRSLKADVDVRRVKAFVKRMLQVLNLHQPSFVCGVLYLIIELCVSFPDLKTLLNEPEEHDLGLASDETTISSGPVVDDGLDEMRVRPETMYDGRKRDPEYSNAHRSCLWELLPFLRHFHPSVDVYATDLLQGQQTTRKPELASHSLIAFLDKFVYRNAKAGDNARGASIMQPIHMGSSKAQAGAGTSLNTAAFWNKRTEDVAVEDVFFHEYFTKVGKAGQDGDKKKKRKATEADGASVDDEGSEAGEDEIWQALVNSRPDVEGDDDSEAESDAEFNDLMGLDDSDEDMGDAAEAEDMSDVEAGESDGLEGLLDDEDGDEDEDDAGSDEDEEDDARRVSEPEAGQSKKPESAHKARRRALKNLPMFASVDDYADMLAQEEDGL